MPGLSRAGRGVPGEGSGTVRYLARTEFVAVGTNCKYGIESYGKAGLIGSKWCRPSLAVPGDARRTGLELRRGKSAKFDTKS